MPCMTAKRLCAVHMKKQKKKRRREYPPQSPSKTFRRGYVAGF
jgi:hypothetical protein